MSQRRRFKQTISLGERLVEEAAMLRRRADTAPTPEERDRLLKKARAAEIALEINDWIESPGARPPN
jgi:hypothetical protein